MRTVPVTLVETLRSMLVSCATHWDEYRMDVRERDRIERVMRLARQRARRNARKPRFGGVW